MRTEDTLILSLDKMDIHRAIKLSKEFGPRCYAIKVHSLLDDYGPYLIEELFQNGAKRCFVDYKLHEVPEQIEDRVRSFAKHGVNILTVHAQGGVKMMQAARKGTKGTTLEIYAVSVLSSDTDADLQKRFGLSYIEAAVKFTKDAKTAGIRNIICAPTVVGLLSKHPDLKGMIYTVPGSRSDGVPAGGQKQITTPVAALLAGANRLVVGRQITWAKHPHQAFDSLTKRIESISNTDARLTP